MKIKPNRIWIVMQQGRIYSLHLDSEIAKREVDMVPSRKLVSAKIWNVKKETTCANPQQ